MDLHRDPAEGTESYISSSEHFYSHGTVATEGYSKMMVPWQYR